FTLGRKLAPPSVLTPAKSWVCVFEGLLRQSYQSMARSPVLGSTATSGKNWLLAVRSSLMRSAALQVLPLSSECRTTTFVSLLPLVGASPYTRYTRPLCGPLLRSAASLGAAKMPSTESAGIFWGAPTLLKPATTGLLKAPPTPVGSVLTMIATGPAVVWMLWNVT